MATCTFLVRKSFGERKKRKKKFKKCAIRNQKQLLIKGNPDSNQALFFCQGKTNYWVKKPGYSQTPYFDGYEGQEVVVIDEFYGWLPKDLLCRMCDRYPLLVDTKGGCVNFYPKTIIITSNTDPQEWYDGGLGALERRFTGDLGTIEHVTRVWVPPVHIAVAAAPLVEREVNEPIVCNICKKIEVVRSPQNVCDNCLMNRVPPELIASILGKQCVCDLCECNDYLEAICQQADMADLDEEAFESYDMIGAKKKRRVIYDSDQSDNED